MKLSKFTLLFLFLVGALLAGSLTISCSHQDKKEPSPAAVQPPKKTAAPAPQEQKNPLPAPVKKIAASFSVDFDNVPLSDVALFVTGNTGKGFVFNGTEQKLISWIEYNIPREKLLDSFINTLGAFDLVLKPTNDEKSVFTIDKLEEMKVPYKLNFASSSRGVFFLFGNTVYSKDKFPYPVKHDSGQWFAIVPKSLADQFNATEGKQNAKI